MKYLRILMFVVLGSVSTYAQSVVNTTKGGDTTLATTASSLPLTAFNVTGGNNVVAYCSSGTDTTDTQTAPTDTAGNTYNHVVFFGSSGIGNSVLWEAHSVTGNASDVITCHWSDLVGFRAGFAWQVAGAASVLPVDTSNSQENTGGTLTCNGGSITTTNAKDIVLMGCRTNHGAQTFTQGSGFALDGGASGFDAGGGAGSQSQVFSSIQTAQNYAMTFTVGSTVDGLVIALKAAPVVTTGFVSQSMDSLVWFSLAAWAVLRHIPFLLGGMMVLIFYCVALVALFGIACTNWGAVKEFYNRWVKRRGNSIEKKDIKELERMMKK